ncbi:hypothetical protein GYB22_04905 [bacterium]|nr:hypothetical protein [bacterium]
MKESGKIFGVGFQKTGTSTLREALKLLGYSVKDTSTRALIPIMKEDWAKVKSMLDPFDAAEDTPWYIIYKKLDELYPGSKFILTEREPESWYNSVNRHIGDLRDAQHEWIYGRGKGLPKDDKENTIRVYTEHNAEVKRYFQDRPNDLLVVDFTKGEGWKELCEFLGREMPQAELPHYNKWSKKDEDRSSLAMRFKFWRKQVKSNIKIWYIDQLGLWKK